MMWVGLVVNVLTAMFGGSYCSSFNYLLGALCFSDCGEVC
jgi:hypothetical protein